MMYTFARQHMHPPLWEGKEPVAIMAPASTCYSRESGRIIVRKLPPAFRPVAADSGGFVFASKYGEYPFTPAQYVTWLEAMQPDWAACMDYPVEVEIAPYEAQVRERQEKAIAHAHTLLNMQRPWKWVPVLQGRSLDHYLWHLERYREEGLLQPSMAIGSLCRRTSIADIAAVVQALTNAAPPMTRFHLFGVKLLLFKQANKIPDSVVSADTAAWNGMFGAGRTKWKDAQRQRGISQREFESEQLYVYKAKVDAALAGPKQLPFAA